MAVEIPFQKDLKFEYGVSDRLSPLIRRVIANNPGPFTFFGTGTYLIGSGDVMVIDPGPADQQHINAILSAVKGESISHILVTHTHLDHSPGCKLLQAHTNARTFALGSHGLGRKRDDTDFGADWEFQPDVVLHDGEIVSNTRCELRCHVTPGHAANHLSFCLEAERALFCGDAVMGWSTTIVSPPDGNMFDYMNTLQLLRKRNDQIYYPTHGAPIKDPGRYVDALYEHRLEREQQVLNCVAEGHHTIEDMLPVVYNELDPSMYPAAARSLLATVECLLHKRCLAVIKGDRSFYELAPKE